MENDYYVYVYIDPRNGEEFYYGKGRGSRKEAHLFSRARTKISKRIAAIRKAGLEPIVRVIAANLTQRDAFLVEAALLWKAWGETTNIVRGHFAENFRPDNTMDRELPGFDFKNGIYYYNVGEGKRKGRNWDDYTRYGFISAGQGLRWRDAICGFQPGDIIVAYLKSHGFVGVGRIMRPAKMARDVRIGKKHFLDLKLKGTEYKRNVDNPEKSEYVAIVQWIKTFPRNRARWRSGLFTTQLVRASLANQQETIKFIEGEFKVNINKLVK